MSILYQILLVILFTFPITIVHNVGTLILCGVNRVRVEKFGVFFGKPIATFKTEFCTVQFGSIPAGGFVSFNTEQFDKLPLLKRLSIVCVGPLSVLILASVILHYDGAVKQFVSAFPQIIRGVLSPSQNAVPLIRAFSSILLTSPFVAFGVLAAKMAAFQFFPFPSLAGGRVLIEMAPGRRNCVRTLEILQTLIILSVVASWLLFR